MVEINYFNMIINIFNQHVNKKYYLLINIFVVFDLFVNEMNNDQ